MVPAIHGRRVVMVLACVAVALLCCLGAVRFLDGRRDRHSEILLSLLHLSDLLGREDAATTAVLAGPAPPSRLADLRSATTEIPQRLRYLRRLGMGRDALAGLVQDFATYEVGAARARSAGRPEDMAAQVHDLRDHIDRAARHERNAFAGYDRALDTFVVVVLAAGAVGAGGAATLMIRTAGRSPLRQDGERQRLRS